MTPWAYNFNTFLSITESNYELAFKIISSHVNSLVQSLADPFYKERHDYIEPLFTAYDTEYTAWKNSGGFQKGDTLTVYQYLALASKNLNKWEGPIISAYPKGSSEYMTLFPQGRYPYMHGSLEGRINTFDQFQQKLTTYAPLAGVQIEAKTYWQQMHDARDKQQQAKSGTGQGSSKVEQARIALCEGMFVNLMLISAHNVQTLDNVKNYFPLDLIRRHEQVIFHQHLKPEETHFLVKHTFAPDDDLTIINMGNTLLYFYLGMAKNSPFVAADSLAVAAGETKTIHASAIGAPNHKFLIGHNADALVKGEFEVHFL